MSRPLKRQFSTDDLCQQVFAGEISGRAVDREEDSTESAHGILWIFNLIQLQIKREKIL